MTTTDHQITTSGLILRIGDRGPQIKELQEKLGVSADGDFGPRTREAVVEFQRRFGLAADGVVGPATRAKLFPPTPPSYPNLIVPMHPGRVGGSIKPRGIVWHYTAMLESTELALAKVWSQSRGRGNGATCIIRRNGQIIQLTDFLHNSNHAGGPTTGRAYFRAHGEHPADGAGHHPNSVFIGVELSNPGRVRRNAAGWRIAYTGAEVVPVDSEIVRTDEELAFGNKTDKWGYCIFTDEQYRSADKIVEMAHSVGMENEPVTIVRKKVNRVDYGSVDTWSFETGHQDFDPSRKDDPGPCWVPSAVKGTANRRV